MYQDLAHIYYLINLMWNIRENVIENKMFCDSAFIQVHKHNIL